MSNNKDMNMREVEFLDYHRPQLKSGDYTVEVKLNLESQHETIEKYQFKDDYSVEHSFSVRGPRFTLSPQDVHSVFPPAGSLGDYHNVLPHIILTRSTLPWQRSGDVNAGADTDTGAPPWLALLLFDQSDVTAQRVSTSRSVPIHNLVSTHDMAYRDDDVCKVIDVNNDLLGVIAPTYQELRWLTHVRKSTLNGEQNESAVVVCRRLPVIGNRSTIHLVSMEGLYTSKGIQIDSNENGKTSLVSLKSWQFSCIEGEHDFSGLLQNLTHDTLKLPLPQKQDEAEALLASGRIPLNHKTRSGQETISWFRGPLVPGAISDQKLPEMARKADELLQYDTKLGMLDVSYAAAWELGRLLMIQNKQASVMLYNWKRCSTQEKKEAECCTPHLPCKSPSRKFDFPHDWFERLARLEFIPCNYLLSDENMLPQESIRFFQIDASWMDCLVNGAFSIGSSTHEECEHDCNHRQQKLDNLSVPKSGFLLRSEVVSGWPTIQVDGFTSLLGKNDNSTVNPLSPINPNVRLTNNILFCLFDEVVHTVDIHLPPDVLHFGFDRFDPENSAYIKKIDKSTNGDSLLVDVHTLASGMTDKTPATFAVEMIVPVPRVRFKVYN